MTNTTVRIIVESREPTGPGPVAAVLAVQERLEKVGERLTIPQNYTPRGSDQ